VTRAGLAGGCVALTIIAATLTGVAQDKPFVPVGDRPFVPVTDEMLWKPNPADWLTWRRTLDSWGFSPLNQINRSNVAQMKMTWTRGMGPGNVQEATPLIYNGVMYLPNPSDLVQAIDARTGDLLWQYQRKLPADLGKFMPVFAINRNLAIYGDKIIDTSADDYVFALDAKTGALAWAASFVQAALGTWRVESRRRAPRHPRPRRPLRGAQPPDREACPRRAAATGGSSVSRLVDRSIP